MSEMGYGIRGGKLNSQFIVTTFSILHVGGRSLFRFQMSINNICDPGSLQFEVCHSLGGKQAADITYIHVVTNKL